MSQRNITELPKPPKDYRVDQQTCRDDGRVRFETRGHARLEDDRRAKGLRSAARLHSDAIAASQAISLASNLEARNAPDTPACSRYMRESRIRIVGALWQLMDDGVTTFTVIPKSWEFTPEELEEWHPESLLHAFRADLYRMGAAKTAGWLFVAIHGEFDPEAEVYRLHLHGACSSGVVRLIDSLRQLDNYRSERLLPDGSPSPVYRRVWVRRMPLTNMPEPITYLLQSFWPCRPIYISAEGKRTRVRQKWSIREPYHSQVLLWLDRWSLKELTLMVGLRVTKDGLKVTRRSS